MNKKLIYIAILCIILFSYSTFAYDLSDYPYPFIKDGKFNGVIVVGDNAPAEHVIATADIAVSLQSGSPIQQGSGVTVQKIDVGATYLASEVPNIKSVNSILIGGPCDNGATAEIMGNPSSCRAGFEPGVGIIEAYENFGNVALVVAGYSEIDTRNAAAVLANYRDYKNKLKGSKVEVIKVNNILTVTPLISKCTVQRQGLNCLDYSVTSTEIGVEIQNSIGSDISDIKVGVENCGKIKKPILRSGEKETFKVKCDAPISSSRYSGQLFISYIDSNTGALYTSEGYLSSEVKRVEVVTKETPTTETDNKKQVATIEDPDLRLDFGLKSDKKPNFSTLIIIFVAIILLSVGIYGILKFKKRSKKEKVKEEEPSTETKKAEKPSFVESVNEAISVSNFTLKHGRTVILENVDIDINKGEMVCLLGPSGTGKSTIIEALVGRKTPTKGTLKILGQDIRKNKKVYDYVGFVPQHAELYMNQTVMQNLLSSATKWGIKDAKNKTEKILSKIDLLDRKDLKASKLSGGQQKLLSLGMELIRDIEVCILDEPTTGLDPNTRNNIITILSQLCTQLHKTIFFTTHFMDDAEECDQVIILADKKIVAQGPPTKLEKSLPGGGKIINIILDNVTDDLLDKIEKLEGVKKIVREGRNLRIITDEPNAIRLGQKIDEIGGVVNETKIDRATMMEVFVYYTGKEPEK